MSWDDVALFAWLLVLTAAALYTVTRGDDAIHRIKKLEDATTRNRDPQPRHNPPANQAESSQERPKPSRPTPDNPPRSGRVTSHPKPATPLEWIDTHPTIDTPTHPPPAPPTAPITAQPPDRDPRPWVDEELDRWRQQQAGRTPRRHRQEDQ